LHEGGYCLGFSTTELVLGSRRTFRIADAHDGHCRCADVNERRNRRGEESKRARHEPGGELDDDQDGCGS
jgi:hypothetical protein